MLLIRRRALIQRVDNAQPAPESEEDLASKPGVETKYEDD